MRPTRVQKVIALALCFTVSIWMFYLGVNASRAIEKGLSADVCLIDPILDYFQPASAYLGKHILFRDIITGIDGIFIDFSLVVMGLIYLVTSRSISFLPTVILFYLIRAIANNIAIFPVPKIYIFEYPGVPSYFVDYRRLNDLYYSGHTGMFVVYIIDCFQCKRSGWNFIFVPFCIYTIFILLVEGIHYGNDIIYGFASAALLARIVFRYRYNWNLVFFKAIVLLIRLVKGAHAFLKEKIAQFQGKSETDPTKAACPGVSHSSLENVNVSAGMPSG